MLLSMATTVRRATIEDAEAIARVHVASWRTTYSGLVPQAYLDALDVPHFTELWREWIGSNAAHLFVAETNGEVCGFVSGGALREPLAGIDAEVYAIYLLQSAQGRGIGRRLMRQLVDALRSEGVRGVAVWVLAANPARGFYEHLGGAQAAAKPLNIGGADLIEIAFVWPDIGALAP
jgi:ribosomal protein S18 acetylase RimI-like enzyme